MQQQDSLPSFGDRLQASFDQVFRQTLPALIGALVILFAGYLLAKVLEKLVEKGLRRIRLNHMLERGGVIRALARLGRGGVILLAVFMALQELGIATDIVTTAFAILFGAIALALALSFGLGNRELAGEITREWYERYRRERSEALAREQKEE